jgi:pilus assembly protein Flp/PilA
MDEFTTARLRKLIAERDHLETQLLSLEAAICASLGRQHALNVSGVGGRSITTSHVFDLHIAYLYNGFTDVLGPSPKLAAMTKRITTFLKDESGATAIEYGLIAAGISVAIIAVVSGLGTKLKTTFSSVSTALK